MAAFNLTAELNLRGPSNLNQIVGDIRRQLSTISLDLNINPNTSRGIQAVTSNINNLSTALRNAQNNAATLSTTLSTLATNINNVGGAANNINNSFNRLNTQTRSVSTGIGDAASEMEQFGRQSALAIRRFAAFSVATGGIYTLVRAISSAYSEFVNFNREFVRLQQVTNTTASGLSGLADEITRLSTGLGVSSSELLNVSTTLAQAGLSATQTRTALEALAKSALAPSFDSLNDTVEGSIALMRQFGISAGELEGALGSINAVAAKFAVEAGDIITAIQRTGGVFATASKGVSEGTQALNEFIAVFTSVRATTRESAETIATGLRTIFTRIQRGGTIQALKEFGITLTDLQGKFVGPYEAIRRLSEGLKSLDPRDLRFSQIVEELGGFRQIGKVIPLIQQFATTQQALGVAQKGAGSLAADSAKAQEALAIRITKVREEFIGLIRDIGQTQSFQKFVDVSLSLASALISIASAAKEVLPALTAVAAIRAIPAIGEFARGFSGGLGRPQRRFASGGMVPGSGNRDTVPAMLTPGEFVIRKKAVESIGVDKLSALNRNGGGSIPQYFNSGGLVQKFMDGKFVKKSKIPYYANPKAVNEAFDSGTAVRTFGLAGILGGAGQGSYFNQRLIARPKGFANPVPVKIQVGTLEKAVAKQKFAQDVDDEIKIAYTNAVTSTATKLSGELKSSTQPSAPLDDIIKNSGFQQVVGSVFEAALNQIGAPFFAKGEGTKSIDFPFGLGSAASLFKIPGNVPTDATRTVGSGGKGPGRMIGQIERFLAAEAKGLYKLPTQSFTSSELRNLYARARDRQTAQEINNILFATGKQSGKKAIPLFSMSSKKAGIGPRGFESRLKENDEAIKILRERGYFAEVIENAKGGMIKHFALGGSAGSDTVPAMLTPGEFVINKQAAQRIGSSNLHKLNNADKVKGFNKGGSVGGVQHFAEGGSVLTGQNLAIAGVIAGLAFLTRRITGLDQVIGRTSGSLSRFNRTVDMGLPRTGQGTARGTNTRNFTNQGQAVGARGISGFGQTADAFGIAFAGGAISTSVGQGVGGKWGSVITEAGAAAANIASLSAALGGLSNPIGQVATGLVSLGVAVYAGIKAYRDAAIEEERKKIERRSAQLEKSFERLAKTTDSIKAKELTRSIVPEIKKDIASEQITSQASVSNALPSFAPSFFNPFMSGYQAQETYAQSVDFEKLSATILNDTKASTENIINLIKDGLNRGQDLNKVIQSLENAGLSKQQINIAIASSTNGQEFARARAEVAVREQLISGEQRKALATREEERTPQQRALLREPMMVALSISLEQEKRIVEESARAFEKENSARQAVLKTIAPTINELRAFAESINNIERAVQGAGARFDEAQRQIDINIGSAFGEESKIAPVSRANEQILSNVAAFSEAEIRRAVSQSGQALGMNQATIERTTSAALSQKVLETKLPAILNEISAAEIAGAPTESRGTELEKRLRPLLEEIKVKPEFASSIIKELTDNFGSLTTGETTLAEALKNSESLNKLFSSLTPAVEKTASLEKKRNDILEISINRMNQYVGALEQGINAQIKAGQIRAQGSIQLDEALGRRVTLSQRNAPANREILQLTRTIGRDMRPIEGTGTTDPREIARRLDAAEQERKALEARKAAGDNTVTDPLSRVVLQIRQLDTAMKTLTNDTTRASNALNEIQRLRQLRDTRQESFLDFAGNANDPEFLVDFINKVGSLGRVMSGRGNIMDIQGARDAFRQRAASGFIEPEQIDREKTQLVQEVIAILERASGSRFDPARKAQIATQFGTQLEEKSAIDEFNAATEKLARANEFAAGRTLSAADEFRTQVVAAGNAFADSVRAVAAAQPAPPIVVAAPTNSTGGLIYANKGQYINFEPKGTDTVPAMLTPGEFVVNARATKQNLGLLKQINNGGKASGFSRGGVVYLADGGYIDPSQLFNELQEAERKMIEARSKIAVFASGYSGTPEDLDAYEAAQARFEKAKNDFQNYSKNYSKNKGIAGNSSQISTTEPSDTTKLPSIKPPLIIGSANTRVSETTQQATNTQTQVTQQQPNVPMSAKQRAQMEKDRRKQLFLEEKERKKQAAMAANPGFARRVAKEEEKKAKELDKARKFAKEKYGTEVPDKEALQVYKQAKREKIQRMNADMARSDRTVAAARQSAQQTIETASVEPSILSEQERKEVEDKTYQKFGYKDKADYEQQSAAEQAKLREDQAKTSAAIAASQTPEAKKEAEDRKNFLADREKERAAERAKWKKDIADRAARDAAARDKGYRDYAQQVGAEARQKRETDLALQKQADEQKRNADRVSVAEGKNAGRGKVARLQDLLQSDPAYENQRKDYALIEFIKQRIDDKHGADLSDTGGAARDRANLQNIVSSASVAYYDEQRRIKTLGEDRDGGQNLRIAKQQFLEGLDQSPILAAGMAIPRAGFGLVEAGVGGAMYLAGTLADNPANQTQDFTGLRGTGALAFEQGLRRVQSVGAGLGSRLVGNTNNIPVLGDLGTEYKLWEDSANKRVSQISDALANQSRGFYETDESTTMGQLLKPENIQRGGMNLFQTAVEGAVDAFGGGGKLVKAAEKSIGRGLSAAARTGNRVIEGTGRKLVDATLKFQEFGNKPIFKQGTFQPILDNGKKLFNNLIESNNVKSTRKWLENLQEQMKPKVNPLSLLIEHKKKLNMGRNAGKKTIDTIDMATKNQGRAKLAGRIADTRITGANSPESIKQIQKTLFESQENVRDVMVKYASSPEKAKELIEKQDQIFGIKEVAIDPNIKSKVNSVSGKVGGVGAEYRSGSETLVIPSKEAITRKGLFRHELFHGVQKNVGTMQGKDAYKFLRSDSLIDLQPQIDEFVKPGGAYSKLVADLGGGVDGAGFYSGDMLAKNHFEILTVLGQAANTKAFQKNKEAQDMLRSVIKSMGYKNGGFVYASKGMMIPYQPRGTDTVPAMLTPGEFVINKTATQRNLPLLKAINNNQVRGYSKGGKVQYFERGSTDGPVSSSGGQSGVSSLVLDSSAFTTAVGQFTNSIGSLTSLTDGLSQLSNLSTALGGISTAAGSLSLAAGLLNGASANLSNPISEFKAALDSIGSVLSRVPSEIKLVASGSIPVLVTVEVNGGAGISENLKPFTTQIYGKITDALRRATGGQFDVELTESE